MTGKGLPPVLINLIVLAVYLITSCSITLEPRLHAIKIK
jgi:hypothetical protein